MKKGFLKRLATENMAEKLLRVKNNTSYPRIIRGAAYLLYLIDIVIFYIFAPFALGGFAYIFYQRENYITFSFSLFLCVGACVLTYKKLTDCLKNQRTVSAR